MSDLRFPVGRFSAPAHLDADGRARAIDEIAALPSQLRTALMGMSEAQLDTPYRPDGWTVRQVVHHLADSHMNSYIRFKLAVTSDNPLVTAYDEAQWAELADGRESPVEISLTLLDALHARWVAFLRALAPADFAKTFRHSQHGAMTLETTVALYAWHARHHLAHITGLKERNGW